MNSLSHTNYRVLLYIRKYGPVTGKEIAVGVFRNEKKWMLSSYNLAILLNQGWILGDHAINSLPSFHFNVNRETDFQNLPRPLSPFKVKRSR